MGKYGTIMELPGKVDEPGTKRGRFARELSELVVFQPGRCFAFQGGLRSVLRLPGLDESRRIETGMGTEKADDYWFVEQVSPDTLDQIGDLVSQYDLQHVKDPSFYALCCDTATKAARGLFLLNHTDQVREKVFFVSSGVQLYSPHVIAHVDEFTREDERYERAIIEDDIWDRDQNIWGFARYTSFYLFETLPQAEEYISEKIKREVERLGHDDEDIIVFENYYVKGQKIVYPKDACVESATRIHNEEAWLPWIVKTYPDGNVLVNDGSDELPLKRYFMKDPKPGESDYHPGIMEFDRRLCACDHCFPALEGRVIQEAQERLFDQERHPHILVNDFAHQSGYSFDPSRIRTNVVDRNPIMPYREELEKRRREREATE